MYNIYIYRITLVSYRTQDDAHPLLADNHATNYLVAAPRYNQEQLAWIIAMEILSLAVFTSG
jgi:hypothetical protein